LVHTIRLREPWDVEPLAGGLKPGEQVWLVVDGAVGFVELTLNGGPTPHAPSQQHSGQGTGADSATRSYDVTTLLALRNELVITTDDSPTAARGEVRLEIHAVE